VLRALDAEDRFPEELVRQLMGTEVGLQLLFVPEEQGGLGAGARDVCRVSEDLAALDLGVATSVLATALGLDPIRVGGTFDQQETWLGRVAEEGLLVAYGVTEPSAGSNVAALRTRAERIEEDGEVVAYRLNGTKCFITNGSVADLYTILALAPEGPSFFVVERGREGLQAGRKEDKHGIRASDTSEVILEDVVVPADRLLGKKEGQGLAQAAKVFGYTRLMVAAFGVGGGVAAIRRAVDYARERKQFGRALVATQGLTHKLLIPHIARLQAARAYIQEIALKLDETSEDMQVAGSVAKLFACEAGCQAADAAVQVHGGYGYMREYHVEKIRRDVRITTIYEGTSEIQQEIAGRARWRELLVSRGGVYLELAETLDEIHGRIPDVGAAAVASAARAMVELVNRSRRARLGRRQHVIFQLADLVAMVEVSAALVRKAAKAAMGAQQSSASEQARRWGELLSAMSRLQAGEAAVTVAAGGYRILAGTGTLQAEEASTLGGPLAPAPLMTGLCGQAGDMDLLAEAMAEEDLLADHQTDGGVC
jgi:alkylation response protein AidB-like acyl-CoA dehydrogenase